MLVELGERREPVAVQRAPDRARSLGGHVLPRDADEQALRLHAVPRPRRPRKAVPKIAQAVSVAAVVCDLTNVNVCFCLRVKTPVARLNITFRVS